MIRKCDDLFGKTIYALDGELGRLSDFYIDESTWEVCFAVIELYGGPLSNKIAISPRAMGDTDTARMKVQLTTHEIFDAWNNATIIPAHREEILQVQNLGRRFNAHEKCAWIAEPYTATTVLEEQDDGERQNKRLCSIRAVSAYSLRDEDRIAGTVTGMLIDDRIWSVMFIIFSPADHSQRLIETKSIVTIDPDAETLRTLLMKDFPAHYPCFDPNRHLNVSCEQMREAINGFHVERKNVKTKQGTEL